VAETERPVIDGLVGVYDARGSLRGELAYAWGKLTGRAHCALCDITHRGVRRRPELERWIRTLPVPLELVHLDERTDDVVAASEGRTPCVLARTPGGLVLLLGPADLEPCAGDVDCFADALRRAVDDHDLSLSTPE
jgi:hypothetical protein